MPSCWCAVVLNGGRIHDFVKRWDILASDEVNMISRLSGHREETSVDLYMYINCCLSWRVMPQRGSVSKYPPVQHVQIYQGLGKLTCSETFWSVCFWRTCSRLSQLHDVIFKGFNIFSNCQFASYKKRAVRMLTTCSFRMLLFVLQNILPAHCSEHLFSKIIPGLSKINWVST